MSDMDPQIGFTQKQNRLLNIATTAKVLAWLFLAFYIFRFGSEVYNFLRFPQWQWGIQISEDVLYLIRVFSGILTNIIQGVVIWLVLLGISLGLKMIVETHFNYQESSLEDHSSPAFPNSSEEENPAVFYDPDLVFKIEGWLDKTIIIAAGVFILDNAILIPSTYQILLSFNFVGSSSWVLWAGAIFLNSIETLVKILLVKFGLKSLGTILLTLMEMEFNSRRAEK